MFGDFRGFVLYSLSVWVLLAYALLAVYACLPQLIALGGPHVWQMVFNEQDRYFGPVRLSAVLLMIAMVGWAQRHHVGWRWSAMAFAGVLTLGLGMQFLFVALA